MTNIKVGRPTEHLKRSTTLAGDSPQDNAHSSAPSPGEEKQPTAVEDITEELPPHEWRFVHHKSEKVIRAAEKARATKMETADQPSIGDNDFEFEGRKL